MIKPLKIFIDFVSRFFIVAFLLNNIFNYFGNGIVFYLMTPILMFWIFLPIFDFIDSLKITAKTGKSEEKKHG